VIVHAAPWVVPIASPPVRDGAVVLDGARVVTCGRLDELRAFGPMVEHAGVLAPGFVNAHTHVELSHLAAQVPGGDGLAPWIRRLLDERGKMPQARALESAASAARAMAARGTVAVIDVTNEGATGPLLRAAGLEALVLEERVALDGAPDVRAGDGHVPTAHSTYTCDAAALAAIAAATSGRVRSIHVEEDPAEAQLLVERSGPLYELLSERRPERAHALGGVGRRPVDWLDALGVIGRGTLLVHLTFADGASLALAARRGAMAVLCPRSNLHISGKLPHVDRIRAAGLRVALGTDSLASSPSLDVLGEVQALARAGVEPAWLLECATLGGARALGRTDLGALRSGARPGLVELGDGARTLADPVAWLAFEGADAPARRITSHTNLSPRETIREDAQ
jgi:cytosine/adenosine deaminase-related metal-dependent hydrolase